MFIQTGNAQDRMPAIPESEMTEEQLAAVENSSRSEHHPFWRPFVPLLRSPEVLSRARNLGDHARFNTVLPLRLSEFVILLTARSGRSIMNGELMHQLQSGRACAQVLSRQSQMEDTSRHGYRRKCHLQLLHGALPHAGCQ
ncbi:MAG: hypothetical protein Ct9H300mP25_07850 [Acidobacteriota bacterium]|nr:MAG: hypothetical protein Ct9H300mP25_07850 [Acidobacteriota bacterium]